MSSLHPLGSTGDEPDSPYYESAEYLNKTSEKARYYHALLREAGRMFDKGELKDCHEQCLTLLQFPYLPNYTRIQTLQLAAASTKAFHAGKEFLADAMKLIEQFESAGPPSKQLAKFRRANDELLQQVYVKAKWYEDHPSEAEADSEEDSEEEDEEEDEKEEEKGENEEGDIEPISNEHLTVAQSED